MAHVAVFVYGDGEPGSGAQVQALRLAGAFAARGHAVDVVAVRAGSALRHDLPATVQLVELAPRSRLVPRRLQVYGGTPALARYLRGARPEAMLAAASHVNLAALWARRLAGRGTRLVLRASTHPPPSRLLPRFAFRFYAWADAIVALSDGVADGIVHATGLARRRITTIYNGAVAPELLEAARAPLDHPWFAPGAPPVILSVGRNVPEKDFRTLLWAFARVRAERPARLMIIGHGAWTPLVNRARLLGIADDVAFLGFVHNPFAYMARAAVFCLSSVQEGLCNALVEALACGCPVVSTDCPSGPREILAGGEFGRLVPVRDSTAMAAAILATLANPPDRDRLRARGRAPLFALDPVVERYLDVLLPACRQPPAHQP